MARSRTKGKREELVGQSDPRAALDSAALLAAAKPLLRRLEDDLVGRAKASPAVTAALTARYEAEKAADRTAESFAGWTAALATQVAAAWLLSCVFVRTLEDRGLLKQTRLAGPGAEDSQRQFFQLAPSLTERDYLLAVFRELAHHPAATDLFDSEHSLVWKLSPSAEVAKELLALFRHPTATEPAFRFGQASTRFLGDLYQDLSEDVRKRYALLQTPDFVETYILDRTLEPAIARFGLDDTTLIDPTCGSGHFLLGAFERLFEHRLRAEPGIDPRSAAVKALDGVYGADINPFAVAIARFRVTLAFLAKAGYARLADAPALPLRLVVADSLRINPQHPQQELWQHAGEGGAGQWLGEVFALDDERAAKDVLGRQYAAVVGNPPYITVKDAALREVYRKMYVSCHRNYALSAPFCERIFQLARPRGFTGQITANSFMKREFGKPLVEAYLPTVNLERIVNTSGAYIPGHGTPTVLLFGTSEPRQGSDVHAVLAKRGEPSTPDEPSQGLVWRSIVDHGDEVGFENDYLSVARVARDSLAKHPWSLGGGGASELKELLEDRAAGRLSDVISSPIGRAARIGADDVFTVPAHVARMVGGHDGFWRDLLIGEAVRDWSIGDLDKVVFPYDEHRGFTAATSTDSRLARVLRFLWPWRSLLVKRATFQGDMAGAGLQWFEYMQYTRSANMTPLSITFAFVATHNHFVLDRGGKVFNRTAPIIKLPEGATEDDHLALLAYLNSSTACFWMKQVCQNRGAEESVVSITDGDTVRMSVQRAGTGSGGGYEFAGTPLGHLPIPTMTDAQRSLAIALAREAIALAETMNSAASLAANQSHEEAISIWNSALHRLVAVQEEVDWLVYEVCGLVEQVNAGLPAAGLALGERPFEVAAARRFPDAAQVFGTEGYVLAASIPPQLAARQREAFVARLEAIDVVPEISLLENEAYKHRWAPKDLKGEFEEVERSHRLTAQERRLAEVPEIRTVGRNEAHEVGESAVPFLAALRYTDDGLATLDSWLQVWEAQRKQDEGVPTDIDAPPKYGSDDFRVASYYKLRGSLDVPKERFISYPHCESDNDGEPVYGWAGWDHLQRAQALAALYLKRKDGEGWTADRLTPMLTGLLELIPWVKQWHNEPSAQFDGLQMGDYYEQFLDGECRQHGLTRDDLRAWRPPKKVRGGANKKQAAKPNDGSEAAPRNKKSSKKTPKTDDASEAS